jgi:hypothetical protein
MRERGREEKINKERKRERKEKKQNKKNLAACSHPRA